MALEPETGKALEVKAGQILRIDQIEGLQCVDFNCFNLHDYKEFMRCGRTRTVHGFNPTKGAFLWSAPPRERALTYILKDTVGRNDLLFPRCSAYAYESATSSCIDRDQPRWARAITRQNRKPGDHVDLLALVDVLAAPNVCGADVMRTSNFALKPIKLTLFEVTD
jgi:uncharacterized protein